MHSFLKATCALINKKSSITYHINFIYPQQVYSCEATNHKLIPALKRNIFLQVPYLHDLQKFTLFTCSRMLLRWLLADTSANHMTRFCGTLVPHQVRNSHSITLLVIVHMQQEYHMLTLGSQRTKEAFRTWLRYVVPVYQIAHSYEERMHNPQQAEIAKRLTSMICLNGQPTF